MGFAREAVESVGGSWSDAEALNAALDQLRLKQATVVDPLEPELGMAKVAWAIVVFEQAIIHRLVMLADGCADAWNGRNILTSMLAARALVETMATLWEFETELKKRVAQGELSPLFKAVVRRTFGTKLKGWISEGVGIEAIHINDALRSLERTINGMMGNYDMMSEMCHPNSLGHHQMFTDTEKPGGIVRFNPLQRWEHETYHLIASAFFLIKLVDQIVRRIHEMLPRIIAISDAARDKPPA